MSKKYFDSSCYDVVLMNTYHILLGRWWQFDRRVVYDGRKNIYTFNIKGKCIVLAFMREKMEIKAIGRKNLFSLSQFMKEIKSEGVVFALIPRSTIMKKEEEDDNSKKARGVLVEFQI